MKRIVTAQAGLTLLEVIIVLSVLGALTAIVGPAVVGYVEDGNIARTETEARRLAVAINKMYSDTGRYPFYKDGDGALSYASGTDAALLTSNAACSGGSCTDATLPDDDSTGDSWGLATGVIDNIGNHLITNTPFGSTDAATDYVSEGFFRSWRGPYVDGIPTVDPWGRSFVVNIGNTDPSVTGGAMKWVLVISGGPNGAIESNANALLTSSPAPAGDDIVARVR